MFKLVFWSFKMILLMSVATVSAEDQVIVEGVTATVISDRVANLTPKYLRELKSSERERRRFASLLYFESALEKMADREEVANDPEIIAKLKASRKELLLRGLVTKEVEKVQTVIEEVAKERYEINKDKYKTRKRIQISIIRLRKDSENTQNDLKRLEKLLSEIKESKTPDKTFSDFAKKHSVDENAKNGGRISKWIIVPVSDDIPKEKNAVARAAFLLENDFEVSDIVKLENSYNLVMLMAKTPSAQLSFTAVKKEIMQEIYGDIRREKLTEVRQALSLPDDAEINDELLLGAINKMSDLGEAKVKK